MVEPVNKSWQIQAAGYGGAGQQVMVIQAAGYDDGACQQVMADPSCRSWSLSWWIQATSHGGSCKLWKI